MGLSLSLSLQPALPAFAVLSLSVNCFDLFLRSPCLCCTLSKCELF
jgi:hypothetical protein